MLAKENRDRELREVERLIHNNRDGILPAISFEIRTMCREMPYVKLVIPKAWLFKRIDASDSCIRRSEARDVAKCNKKGWLIGKHVSLGKDAYTLAFIPEVLAHCKDMGDTGLVDLGLWGINRNGNETLISGVKDFKKVLRRTIKSVTLMSVRDYNVNIRNSKSLTFRLVSLREWLRKPMFFKGSIMNLGKKSAMIGVWAAKKRTCLRLNVPKRWVKLDTGGYDVMKIQTRRDFKIAMPDDAMLVLDGIQSGTDEEAGLFRISGNREEMLVDGKSPIIGEMFQRYLGI